MCCYTETSFCPANWMKFGNSCYLLSTSKKNWTDSRQFCENCDAQLVIISSEMEQVSGQKKVSFCISYFCWPSVPVLFSAYSYSCFKRFCKCYKNTKPASLHKFIILILGLTVCGRKKICIWHSKKMEEEEKISVVQQVKQMYEKGKRGHNGLLQSCKRWNMNRVRERWKQKMEMMHSNLWILW